MFKSRQLITRLNLFSKSLNTQRLISSPSVMKGYKQVQDLHTIIATAQLEEDQRTEKFLEYTSKIYKPSSTIEFNREGELLLFSCDNFRLSQVYLKYPYVMFDAMIPLSFYIFWADPCK
jgi:hypothetical protein